MKTINLKWDIYNDEIEIVERYCHNCGKKADFVDSLKRRQNANGKNIYHFAIYKCPKGHTWNKEIEIFKAKPGIENIDGNLSIRDSSYEELELADLKNRKIEEVSILINALQKKIRVDKFLSSTFKDATRGEIIKLLEEGFIRINGERVKKNASIREKDIILIRVGGY